jgi:hypothetical protein
VIIDRHAPFDFSAIAAHLKPGDYFITQQVGVFWLNTLDMGLSAA